MKLTPSFWKDKKVLITGHTGFKGSWLAFWLCEWGAQVHGIALTPSTNPSAFEAMAIKNRVSHNLIDVRNRDEFISCIEQIQPEIVFHLAAQPLVRESYRSPLETYETNVIGTGNLLWSLTKCKSARAIVVVTTDKCYENREWDWGYRETDRLGGHDPYSSSKACAEILTASFRRSFYSDGDRCGIATVRAGNVIGGGDWSSDRLIPDVVRAMQSGSRLEIRNPLSIRPWQHVLVPLSGYMLLAEKLLENPIAFSEAYNFAPSDNDCLPVRDVLNLFGQAWGNPVDWFQTSGQHAHEARFLKLDSSKAKAQLHWAPKWNLEKALAATAQWYRAYYETPDQIEKLTRSQISEFIEL